MPSHLHARLPRRLAALCALLALVAAIGAPALPGASALSQETPASPPSERDEQRTSMLAALGFPGKELAERLALVARLFEFDLAEAELAAVLAAFPERDRRELVAFQDRLLRSPTALTHEWVNAARLAELAPDATLAPALLDRLERVLKRQPDSALALVHALRSALDTTRRRIAELEAERLAQATSETCVAQLESSVPEVRRAALARLIDLAQRRGEARDPALERARERAFELLAAAAPDAAAPLALEPEELRLCALLAAELSPYDDEAKQRWLAWFAAAPYAETRLAVLAALRRLVRDEPDAELAAELARQLAPLKEGEPVSFAAALPMPLTEAMLEALRFVGDESSLDALTPWLASDGPPRARLQQRAVTAAAELARRSRDPAFTRRVLDLLTRALEQEGAAEVRVDAALGLALVIESINEASREGAPAAALDAENLSRAFDALRRALPRVGSERGLAEQCCKALCKVPGKRVEAAHVLAGVLTTGDPAAGVREVLLRGLKELAEPVGIPAIVAALTKGGPSVEPDALGKEAYAALLAVLRSAAAAGRATTTQLDVVTACHAAGESEWAIHFATQLMDANERDAQEAQRNAIRLAFGGAAAKARGSESLERAWTAVSAVANDAAATPAQRGEARRLLLDLAERTRPLHAAEAAARAEQLLAGGEVTGADRTVIVRRGAALWLVAGAWAKAYELLDRELEERGAPAELLVLKARAAARRDDPAAARDALRLHELLVGARGHGGKLAADAADRWSLLLALAQIYVASARGDDARATLGVLPPEESLPAELQQELQQLRKSLSG